jgi:3-hydroxyacyl-[acyl-carrier-protein] dehydratase
MENHIFAGYHDLTVDAWWVRGHIPGRPLFPGVLMIEVAAQLASVMTHSFLPGDRFIGFGGVSEVKFRGAIEPPARFLVIGKAIELRSRRTVCQAQGFVNGTMVFEAAITGMTV